MADIQLIVDSTTVVDANKQISKIGTGMQTAARSASQSAGVFVSAFNSMEASVKKVERANANFEKAAQSNFNAILGVDKAFKSAKSSASAFQAELNRADGLQKQFNEILKVDRAFDSAEESAKAFTTALKIQDREVDRLAKKFNPLYAASKQYEFALEELSRAQKLGAISSAQYGNALDKLNSDFNEFNRGVVRVGNQFGSFDRAAYKSAQKLKRFGSVGMQQVGYQVGDFAVQVQGGQNALVALGQQGTQLLGIFGPAGAIAGAFFAVGTAIANVVWQSYKAREGIKTLDAAISDIEQSFTKYKEVVDLSNASTEDLRDTFGSTATNIKATLTALSEFRFDTLMTNIRALSNNFKSAFSDDLNEAFTAAGSIGGGFGGADIGATVAKNAIRILKRELGLSVEQAKALKDSIDALGEADGLQAAYDSTAAFRDTILSAYGTIKNIPPEFKSMFNQVLQANEQLGKMVGNLDRSAEIEKILLEQMEMFLEAQKEVVGDSYLLRGELRNAADEAFRLRDALQEVANLEMSGNDRVSVLKAQIAAARGGRSVEAAGASSELALKLSNSGMSIDAIASAAQSAGKTAEEIATLTATLRSLTSPGKPSSPTKPSIFDDSKMPPMPERRPTDVAAEAMQKLITDRTRLLTLSEEEIKLDEIRLKVLDALGDKQSYASEKQIESTVASIAAAEKAIDLQQQLDGIANTIGDAFGNAFMGIVDGTQTASDAFKTMAATILKELFKILVVERLVNSISSVVSGGFSTASGSISPTINPHTRAGGGSAMPGQTLLVGERGPELINMGANRGTVMNAQQTANAGGSGSVTVHQSFNFQANGDESVKRIIAEAAPKISQMAVASVVNQRARGGQMKRTFG